MDVFSIAEFMNLPVCDTNPANQIPHHFMLLILLVLTE
jgi:hypothetical protein